MLERLKDENEKHLKREKEIEKSFKRIFDQHHPFAPQLKPLLKLSCPLKYPTEDINPFRKFEEQVQYKFVDLSSDSGWNPPEGLNQADIEQFKEIRAKKIQYELDALRDFNRIEDVQMSIQSMSDLHDKTKMEMDRIGKKYADNLENLFLIDYNSERIMQLKQGQVKLVAQVN